MGSHIRVFWERILSIFRKRELDDDFNEELASHIEMATEDNIREGMNPEEAHRQALIRFGGIDAAKELHRDTRGIPLIENITLDVRYAFRMFCKNPGFSLAVIITLALCIGANTAIFSVLDALVIKPLPFHESDRIVSIYTMNEHRLEKHGVSIPQYLDFKENADMFSHLALWQTKESNLGIGDQAIRSPGVSATSDIFGVLGLNPVLGRFFLRENNQSANNNEVVLTQSFWMSHFQKDPGIIGRAIQIDGEDYEVIGIAPETFESFDARPWFITPLKWMPWQANNRSLMGPDLLGRLKPDATISAAVAQMTALEERAYSSTDRHGAILGMETLQSSRVDPDLKLKLYLLQGAVLFVLLIGCVNVINMFLSRSNSRQGELAVRITLGSGKRAISRQLFVESFLLTWIGSTLGVILALGIIKLINGFTAQLLPNSLPFTVDGRMLAFTAIVATLVSLIIGLFQVFHVFSRNLMTLTQNQNQRASNSRRLRTMSGGLIITQMAITLVLLIGGGLLIHSFANLLAVDPGFNQRQLVASSIALPASYNRDNRDKKFRQQLEDSLSEISGFTSVSFSQMTPYTGDFPMYGSFSLEEYEGDSELMALFFSTDSSYLETMQIPLIEGRWFNTGDTDKSRPVCVVNQNFARQYFPESSAVGKYVGSFPDSLEIVGVVGAVRDLSLEERLGRTYLPYVYRPMKQYRSPFGLGLTRISVLIRSPLPAPEVIALLREKVKEIDPALPLYKEGSVEKVIGTSFNDRRAIMLLLCSFAGIALILSAVGIYGVLAYDVSKRTHEIGIRSSIGATEKQIITMVLRQGLWKAGLGLVIGIVGALYLSKFMTNLLFDVTPIDPITFILVPVLLLVVAVLASYIPARQASRVEPARALRAE